MPPPIQGNLLSALPAAGQDEHVTPLLLSPGLRIERIVSHGQISPPGFWYDQPEEEWVLVMAGRGTLAFADGQETTLGPGDWISLPAHCRHRVVRTDDPTVWLAVFPGKG